MEKEPIYKITQIYNNQLIEKTLYNDGSGDICRVAVNPECLSFEHNFTKLSFDDVFAQAPDQYGSNILLDIPLDSNILLDSNIIYTGNITNVTETFEVPYIPTKSNDPVLSTVDNGIYSSPDIIPSLIYSSPDIILSLNQDTPFTPWEIITNNDFKEQQEQMNYFDTVFNSLNNEEINPLNTISNFGNILSSEITPNNDDYTRDIDNSANSIIFQNEQNESIFTSKKDNAFDNSASSSGFQNEQNESIFTSKKDNAFDNSANSNSSENTVFTINNLQLLLDIASFMPTLSVVTGLANAIISLLIGNYRDASIYAILPISRVFKTMRFLNIITKTDKQKLLSHRQAIDKLKYKTTKLRSRSEVLHELRKEGINVHNVKEVQKWMIELQRAAKKPLVKDTVLKKIVAYSYRKNAKIGSGSTADAHRYEKMTGKKVGRVKVGHEQKLNDIKNSLENWLSNNKNIGEEFSSDKRTAELLYRDALEALKLTKSFKSTSNSINNSAQTIDKLTKTFNGTN